MAKVPTIQQTVTPDRIGLPQLNVQPADINSVNEAPVYAAFTDIVSKFGAEYEKKRAKLQAAEEKMRLASRASDAIVYSHNLLAEIDKIQDDDLAIETYKARWSDYAEEQVKGESDPLVKADLYEDLVRTGLSGYHNVFNDRQVRRKQRSLQDAENKLTGLDASFMSEVTDAGRANVLNKAEDIFNAQVAAGHITPQDAEAKKRAFTESVYSGFITRKLSDMNAALAKKDLASAENLLTLAEGELQSSLEAGHIDSGTYTSLYNNISTARIRQINAINSQAKELSALKLLEFKALTQAGEPVDITKYDEFLTPEDKYRALSFISEQTDAQTAAAIDNMEMTNSLNGTDPIVIETAKQKKTADAKFMDIIRAPEYQNNPDLARQRTLDFIGRTNYIPTPIKQNLEYAVSTLSTGESGTGNVDGKVRAVQNIQAIKEVSPAAYEGLDASVKSQAYEIQQALAGGLTSEQAVSSVEAVLRLPANELKQREEGAKTSLKILGYTPEVRAIGNADERARSDFRAAYTRHYMQGYSHEQSQKYAERRLSEQWGESEMTGRRVLMKYPPEKYYFNPIDDSTERVAREKLSADFRRQLPDYKDAVLVSDEITESEIISGRLPSYKVIYTDEDEFVRAVPNFRYRYGAK